MYENICLHSAGHANHHLENSLTSTAIDEGNDSHKKQSESYGFEFQICHKLEFIMSVLNSNDITSSQSSTTYSNNDDRNISDDVDVMIISHSIGSYILLEALSRNEQLMRHTKHILFLMPFISWKSLPYFHRSKLSTFLSLHEKSQNILSYLAGPLIKMSPTMRLRLLKSFTGTGVEGDVIATVSNNMINKRIIKNFSMMGYEEVQAVRRNSARMLSLLEELDRGKSCGSKHCFFLYTNDDDWAPTADAKLLFEKLQTSTTIVLQTDLTHGFSLTEERINTTCSLIMKHFMDLDSRQQEITTCLNQSSISRDLFLRSNL